MRSPLVIVDHATSNPSTDSVHGWRQGGRERGRSDRTLSVIKVKSNSGGDLQCASDLPYPYS